MADKHRAALPPDPALIACYLTRTKRMGLLKPREETERVQAVHALHALYRQWQQDVATALKSQPVEKLADSMEELRAGYRARGAPQNFDSLLRAFFDKASRRIWASRDPPETMAIFWHGKPRRGRRAEDNADRNLELAVAVQQRVDAGASVEAAIGAVVDEERWCLSAEAIHKIYYGVGGTAAQAELALRALRDPVNWRSGSEEEEGTDEAV
jgi:hypothetical protein